MNEMMLSNIPAELQAIGQWILHDSEKQPWRCDLKAHASSTNPADWATFAQVVAAVAFKPGWGIGFVLSDNDPFTCVDLDTYKTTDSSEHRSICEAFNSYSELSLSGGVHVWVRGKVATRKETDKHFEVYSTAHYMIMTGNAINNVLIMERQELLDNFWNHYFRQPVNAVPTSNVIEAVSEGEIWKKCVQAASGDKFQELWEGRWEGAYPSQSEADQALCNLLAFWTDDKSQAKRLFLKSALGQRDKATKRKDYVSGLVKKSFDRKIPGVDPTSFESANPNKAKQDSTCIALIRGSQILEKPDRQWWLPHIFPKSTLMSVQGDPGVGKTTFCLAFAAVLSATYGQTTLMLSNEGDLSDIKKLFRQLSGNLDYLLCENFDEKSWELNDSSSFENTLIAHKPACVIIDSLFSHAPGKSTTDLGKHSDVAKVLTKLRALSDKHNVLTIMIHHFNKSSTTDPLKKSAESQGIIGTCRHNIMIGKHPEDKDLRVAVTIKTNIDRLNAPGRLFCIEPTFDWKGETNISPFDLLKNEVMKDGLKGTGLVNKTMTAINYLMNRLPADGSEVPQMQLLDEVARLYEVGERTLSNASLRLGVKKRKDGLGKWLWSRKAAD